MLDLYIPCREELIKLCEDGVVSYKDWNDRDSYSSQVQLSDIYALLKAGVEYVLMPGEWAHHIEFKAPNKEQTLLADSFSLPIDSREDYFEEFGYDNEMFDGCGIDYRDREDEIDPFIGGYLPSHARLISSDGGDWY